MQRKLFETLHKLPNESLLMKKLSLDYIAQSYLSAIAEPPRFHLYSFHGPSLWYLC